jgi:small subunit ribosomal protein S1
VHISELAQHHVENPREIVSQGQPVNVKIIEVDGDRRRLSLSLKRVEDTDPVQPRADGGESVHARPNLDLSEEVFAEATEQDDVEVTDSVDIAEAEVVEDEVAAGYDAAVEPAEEPAAEAEPAVEDAPAEPVESEAAPAADDEAATADEE